MEYLIPTEDDPPKNIEEAHRMIKFHNKIFVLLTSFQLVAVLANQPFVALNIIFCLYMVSYQIWRCIVLINDHFALRAIVDDEEEDEDELEEEQAEEEEEQQAEEECECEEGECEEGGCECEEQEEEQEDTQDVATNGELADDEGNVPMDVVDELADDVDTEEIEPTEDLVVETLPVAQNDEVKPKARRRRRQD
jgi:hypothetical protein